MQWVPWVPFVGVVSVGELYIPATTNKMLTWVLLAELFVVCLNFQPISRHILIVDQVINQETCNYIHMASNSISEQGTCRFYTHSSFFIYLWIQNRGQKNTAYGPKSAHCLFLQIKFCCSTSLLTCLCIIYHVLGMIIAKFSCSETL